MKPSRPQYGALIEALIAAGYLRPQASRLAHGHSRPRISFALAMARNFNIPCEIWGEPEPAIAYWAHITGQPAQQQA